MGLVVSDKPIHNRCNATQRFKRKSLKGTTTAPVTPRYQVLCVCSFISSLQSHNNKYGGSTSLDDLIHKKLLLIFPPIMPN